MVFPFKTAITETERKRLGCAATVIIPAIFAAGLGLLLAGAALKREDLMTAGAVLLGVVGLSLVYMLLLTIFPCLRCEIIPDAKPVVVETKPTVVLPDVYPYCYLTPIPKTHPLSTQVVIEKETQPKEESDCYRNEPTAPEQAQGHAISVPV